MLSGSPVCARSSGAVTPTTCSASTPTFLRREPDRHGDGSGRFIRGDPPVQLLGVMSLARRTPAIARTGRGPIEYRRTGRGPAVLVLKGGHSSRDTRLGHERLAVHGFTV